MYTVHSSNIVFVTDIIRTFVSISVQQMPPYDPDGIFFAVVDNTGKVVWWIPTVLQTMCSLDMRLFPWDNQKCSLIFQSWSHTSKTVILDNLTYVQLK